VISRAARQAEFPARFQLVAAMNPCPCGNSGEPGSGCNCTPDQIRRYRGQVSGPLLDRIDLTVQVPRLDRREAAAPGEPSAQVRARVATARARQVRRGGVANGQLTAGDLRRLAPLDDESRRLLDHATERLGLSERARQRVQRVALTIADLERAGRVTRSHLAEALSYRGLPNALRGDGA
jgi:magnesium chelatase family protein